MRSSDDTASRADSGTEAERICLSDGGSDGRNGVRYLDDVQLGE